MSTMGTTNIFTVVNPTDEQKERMLRRIKEGKRSGKSEPQSPIRWAIPLAGAAAVTVITVAVVSLGNGIATSPTAETTAGAIGTMAIPQETMSPGQTGAVEYPADDEEKGGTAETATVSEEMPEPFETGEGKGGGETSSFYSPCSFTLDNIPGELMDIRDKSEVEQWIASFPSITVSAPGSISEYPNLYSFITRFSITKEEAEAALSRYIDSSDEMLCITREEFDLIFTGDVETITKRFASEYSIVVGANVYSPSWIYTHSTDEYKSAGITAEEIAKKTALYEAMNFTATARHAFADKLTAFTGTEITLGGTAADVVVMTTEQTTQAPVETDEGEIDISMPVEIEETPDDSEEERSTSDYDPNEGQAQPVEAEPIGINITIVDKDGNPVPNLVVTIEQKGGTTVTYTGGEGLTDINGLRNSLLAAPADYLVNVMDKQQLDYGNETLRNMMVFELSVTPETADGTGFTFTWEKDLPSALDEADSSKVIFTIVDESGSPMQNLWLNFMYSDTTDFEPMQLVPGMTDKDGKVTWAYPKAGTFNCGIYDEANDVMYTADDFTVENVEGITELTLVARRAW